MIDKKICHFAQSFCSQNKIYQLARTNIYMIKKFSFLYILGPKLLVHWIKSNGWFDAMWFVKYLLRCIAYCIMHLGLYAFLPYQIPILNLQLEIRNEFIANFDVFFLKKMIVFSHFFKISKSMVWGRNAAMNSLHIYTVACTIYWNECLHVPNML